MIVVDRPPARPLDPARPWERVDIGRFVVGQLDSGRLVAVDETADAFDVSDDDGATWQRLDVPGPVARYGPGHRVVEVVEGGGRLWLLECPDDGGMPQGTGSVRRLSPDLVEDTDVTPHDWPPSTSGRVRQLAWDGTSMWLGTYGTTGPYASFDTWPGARLWRSDPDDVGWEVVRTWPRSRHLHAVRVDPDDADVLWVTTGDPAGQRGEVGLWRSPDRGATWDRLVSTQRYAIDLAFLGDDVVLESDGIVVPMLYRYPRTAVDQPLGDFASLVWPPVNPDDGAGAMWASVRGLHATSEGALFFLADGGAYPGGRFGAWVVQPDRWWAPVLLEELDAMWDHPVSKYGRTFEAGPWLFNARYRMTRPTFSDDG